MSDVAEKDHAIVLFDGVCNYCNRMVNFTIRHDKKNYFLFAPLRSAAAAGLIKKYGVPDDTSNSTFVLIENNKFYLRSTASLRLLRKLNGLYPLLYVFIIVPPFIRDAFYGIIARRRYQWWGKRESCIIPSEEIRKKFL